MTIANISIPLDSQAAQVYTDASAENKRKLRLLMSLWLQEFAMSPSSLRDIMDKMSDRAQARGLTPDILESLLNDK